MTRHAILAEDPHRSGRCTLPGRRSGPRRRGKQQHQNRTNQARKAVQHVPFYVRPDRLWITRYGVGHETAILIPSPLYSGERVTVRGSSCSYGGKPAPTPALSPEYRGEGVSSYPPIKAPKKKTPCLSAGRL